MHWGSLTRIFSQPSENASDSAGIDHADDAKTFASIPLANRERQSLTGVAYSIHLLTCKIVVITAAEAGLNIAL